MIRNNDAAVRARSRSTFLSQQYIVFHIKGQDDAALASGKDELFRIKAASIGSFLSGDTIETAITEDLREQRVNIFVEVEFYGRCLTCCSRLASRSC